MANSMFSKPASAVFPLHAEIAQRWSPRAFADQDIPVDVLCTLLEAARWASSCFNEQPWRFIVARREESEAFQRMLDCLLPANQRWAAKASVLMLTVASMHFAHNGKPNRHAFHDIGLAVAQLVIQAQSMGVGVHQLAGIDVEKIRASYAIPEGFEPVTGLVLGYFGDPTTLPEDLRARELGERKRNPASAMVFGAAWGERAAWVVDPV
jgi:nitroreductase